MDAAAHTDQLVAERAAERVAWLLDWGFADPSARVGAGRAASGSQPTPARFGDQDVLGDVGSTYERPSPETGLLNASRVRAARQALVDLGTFSVSEIARARQVAANTAHKQVQRACERGEMLTVTLNGERHVPAVLLDEALDVRREWQPVISTLLGAGMSCWGVWRWMATPNAGLSGDIAAEVIETQPERVYAAARRRADQIAA